MGYTLTPKNKKIDCLSFGSFSWPIMLSETGAGFIIGYGQGREPASYVYQPRNGSPVSNDGYRVSALEAKMMGQVIRGYISVNRFINKDWIEKVPNEAERQRMQNIEFDGRRLYKTGVAEKRLLELEKFAEFAEKSSGFIIE